MEGEQLTDFPPPHDRPPAYTSRKSGYSSVPLDDYGPPTSYSAPAPPPSGYAPAPPVFQQQSSNNNVVVVGNQPTPQPEVVHVRAPRAPEYLLLTAVMILLCFFHGDLPAIILFLVPALICACAAQGNNNVGDYEGARSCGRAALGCNILAVVYFVLLIIAGIAGALLYFFYIKDHLNTIGNEINNIVNKVTPAPLRCCNYDYWHDYCTYYCT